MARGAQKQAAAAVNNENKVSGDLGSKATSLEDTLIPQYESEITNPQGFGNSSLNAMNTAAQQSTGGATAGAVGAMARAAARTRNRGGYQAGADEAVRSGQREGSQRAVEIQGENAKLKEAQREGGLAGLN